MTQPNNCPTCGKSIDGAQGLCPDCVLKQGLQAALQPEPAPPHPLGAALQAAVGGEYQVQRLLGRGAMGAVFLAREKALDREVAIKVLPPESNADVDRERFRREARIAAGLTHPNIVPLHSFGEAGGILWFVMGYVRGESLGSRMRRGVSVASARRILTELADALDHAHRQGVVHRDVKPDNVLIDDESGRPLLTDFGIARRDLQQGLTANGGVVGTPHYMSPEQASGKTALDGRSDIYSLGVLGYAMLAGRLPFEGKTVGDVLVQHMTRPAPPLAGLAPAVPEALAAVINHCLAKDPRDRFLHARALREALVATNTADDLPEPLREIEGSGLTWLAALAVAAGAELVQWLNLGELREIPAQGFPLGVVGLIGGLILLRRALPVRRAGYGWGRIAWAAFLEPAGWTTWYPRALRRPGEDGVWDRLPARLRAGRLVRLAVPLTALLGVLMAVAFSTPRFHEFRDFPWLLAVYMWPPVVNGVRPVPPSGLIFTMIGWAVVQAAGFVMARINERWLAHFGLLEPDRRAILNGALARPAFWRRDGIAAVLRPKAMDEPSAARTPAEMVHRIVAAAEGFNGRDAPVARDAATAARQILASIQECDREIEGLARDADPQEQDRLRERLTTLGGESASEPEGRRRMRGLFQQQLALLLELQGRLDRASERRQRRVELLKGLWLEIANLRAAATQAPDGETSARVHALCARIEAARNAPSETVPLVDDDSPTLSR